MAQDERLISVDIDQRCCAWFVYEGQAIWDSVILAGPFDSKEKADAAVVVILNHEIKNRTEYEQFIALHQITSSTPDPNGVSIARTKEQILEEIETEFKQSFPAELWSEYLLAVFLEKAEKVVLNAEEVK